MQTTQIYGTIKNQWSICSLVLKLLLNLQDFVLQGVQCGLYRPASMKIVLLNEFLCRCCDDGGHI